MSEPRQLKKRKLSGLSGLELEKAYNAVLKLRNSFTYVESEKPSVPDDDFDDHVLRILAIFEARMRVLQSLSFSNVDDDDLSKSNTISAGKITLKPSFNERIAETPSLPRENEIWSSDYLYRHLNLLESIISRRTKAAYRAWIDALIFRAATMLSSDKRMVLTMEYAVPSVTIGSSNINLSGYIDYAAIVTNETDADTLRDRPQLSTIRTNITGLFITKAESHDLTEDISRAVAELFACAKHLGKRVVRGALTNGHEWIFILVKLNDDRNGASFWQSGIIELMTRPYPSGPLVVTRPYPDLIAGILSHWIQHSFTELASDDWFEVEA